jgi:hypothetical protein
MKVEIEGSNIRIRGERGVDLLVYASSNKDLDQFALSLVYDGFEDGCLPSLEILGSKRILVTNNLKTGVYLLNGREP